MQPLIDLGAVASQVQVATASLGSTLTLLLVSAMLLIGGAVLVGLAGRLAAHAAWRWEDWKCDRQDEYAWHLRSALARMRGLGLNPHTVITLALRHAREQSQAPLRSVWGWLPSRMQ